MCQQTNCSERKHFEDAANVELQIKICNCKSRITKKEERNWNDNISRNAIRSCFQQLFVGSTPGQRVYSLSIEQAVKEIEIFSQGAINYTWV